MNMEIVPAPVRKSVTVKAGAERAFAVFTAGMGRWWSPTHHIGGAPLADVVIEPRAGGRWYEVGTDGSTCEWGKVLVWEPPARVVLAWQIDAAWRHDPAFVTELEIRFTPEAGGTRVDLEHRNIERFGDRRDAVRASLDAEGGWDGLMRAFAEAAARG